MLVENKKEVLIGLGSALLYQLCLAVMAGLLARSFDEKRYQSVSLSEESEGLYPQLPGNYLP